MTDAPTAPDETTKRLTEVTRRLETELRLVQASSSSSGITGMMRVIMEMSRHEIWLLNSEGRTVARPAKGAQGAPPPDIAILLEEIGPVDLAMTSPLMIDGGSSAAVTRRHLLMPVARGGYFFAWLVMSESRGLFKRSDQLLLARGAIHLGSEYVTQRRVARVSLNARSTLARQMVRGSIRDSDLLVSADYLGIDLAADRIVAYLGDSRGGPCVEDEDLLAERVSEALDVEVLVTRGTEETVLVIEVPDQVQSPEMISRVRTAMTAVLTDLAERPAVVGISAVTRPQALRRAYGEAREVAHCVDRFASTTLRIVSVDDLGPARVFVAYSDIDAVRRYAREVLGVLLDDNAGRLNLIRTLQSFVDSGFSVRETAAGIGIHENTVRLRLAKILDLTGLDVAADASAQLSAHAALLVLRLEGHPALPVFGQTAAMKH